MNDILVVPYYQLKHKLKQPAKRNGQIPLLFLILKRSKRVMSKVFDTREPL